MDVIDLRKKKWKPRLEESGMKKLSKSGRPLQPAGGAGSRGRTGSQDQYLAPMPHSHTTKARRVLCRPDNPLF